MLNCNEVASLIGDVILLQAMLLTVNFWNGNGGEGKQKQRNEQKLEWRIKAFLPLFERGRSWVRAGLGYEESFLVRTCTSMGKNCQPLLSSKYCQKASGGHWE